MFKLIKIEGGRINVFEPQKYPVIKTKDIHAGHALKLGTTGVLESCEGTTKPTFVALADNYYYVDGTKVYRDEIAVGRVTADQIYETEVSAAATSLKVGNKVTIEASAAASGDTAAVEGGLRVTATTTSGVAEIVDLCGASVAGDKVLVRFS